MISLTPKLAPRGNQKGGSSATSLDNASKHYKLVTFESLLLQEDPARASDVAKEKDASLGKIAS